MRDLKALARKASGLAPPHLIANARPGAVFTADDKSIHFPTDALPSSGARNLHKSRRVIVVQDFGLNVAAAPPTILVVPCSASASGCGQWDFEIPSTESAFDAGYVVAYTSMVQPILKANLQDHVGELSQATFESLRKVLLAVMGIASFRTLGLPPAPAAIAANAER